MIVGEQKPIEEIKGFLAPFKKVLIAGCGACTTICHAGGENEVKILASGLRIASKNEGRDVEVLEDTVIRQCEPEYIDPLVDQIKSGGVEAVLSLACGVGVNMLAERLEALPVLPGVNTTFYGGVVEEGLWKEYCVGCGDCMLAETAGVCPIVRCSKGLVDGTCGGTDKGKCEVSPDIDCAWYLIFQRLKGRNELEKYRTLRGPRNWSADRGQGPRRLSREDLMKMEEAPAE
jgi:ferredoxin